MNYLYHPQVQLAAAAVAAGRVVAYPTEAVWGLGCNPFNRHACEQILTLKRRPERKGVILVAANIEQVAFLLDGLPEPALAQALASWPGPNTWLVPHNHRVPSWVTGQYSTVALRVSAHPVVRALCLAAGGPLVSTSANPQGLPPARSGLRARVYFGQEVVYAPGLVDRTARPSTIRDLITGATLRA